MKYTVYRVFTDQSIRCTFVAELKTDTEALNSRKPGIVITILNQVMIDEINASGNDDAFETSRILAQSTYPQIDTSTKKYSNVIQAISL
jgi:hypothetical protein